MKNKNKIFRNFIPLLCLLLLAASAPGQEVTGNKGTENEGTVKKLQYGFKVGTTLSSFSSEQPHNNSKPGIIAGGFISYKLSSILALQFEPSYMQQGGNLISVYDPSLFAITDYPFSIEVKDQKITFHNIDIPLLLKAEKNILGLNVFCVAGPALGLNLYSKTENNVSARSGSSSSGLPVYYDYYEEDNITSDIKFLQYGIIGGIGFDTPLGKHTLILDMKYRYGLNKTYKGYSYLGIPQVQGDLKTNAFYITLGFGF
jgi:hypothetical protein